jgi:hypothetical protein
MFQPVSQRSSQSTTYRTATTKRILRNNSPSAFNAVAPGPRPGSITRSYYFRSTQPRPFPRIGVCRARSSPNLPQKKAGGKGFVRSRESSSGPRPNWPQCKPSVSTIPNFARPSRAIASVCQVTLRPADRSATSLRAAPRSAFDLLTERPFALGARAAMSFIIKAIDGERVSYNWQRKPGRIPLSCRSFRGQCFQD